MKEKHIPWYMVAFIILAGWIVFFCVSCTNYVFKLQDGRIVFCKYVDYDFCGVTLMGCDGWNYYCQHNLSELTDDKLFQALLRNRSEKDFF